MEAIAERSEREPVLSRHLRDASRANTKDDHRLVQCLVMLQMMQEHYRYPCHA